MCVHVCARVCVLAFSVCKKYFLASDSVMFIVVIF